MSVFIIRFLAARSSIWLVQPGLVVLVVLLVLLLCTWSLVGQKNQDKRSAHGITRVQHSLEMGIKQTKTYLLLSGEARVLHASLPAFSYTGRPFVGVFVRVHMYDAAGGLSRGINFPTVGRDVA